MITGIPRWGVTPEILPSTLGATAHAVPSADAADRLLLDTAAAWFQAGHPRQEIAVVDDASGALTLGLLARVDPPQGPPRGVRTGQDALSAERELSRLAEREDLSADLSVVTRTAGVEAPLLKEARTVLMSLPRSLDTLSEWCWLIASHAADDVVVLAGGRDKHMSRSMNEVLRDHFQDVVPGRGRSKARVLTARGPRRGKRAPGPRTRLHSDLGDLGLDHDLTVCATGAVYGGTNLDPGTRLLLSTLTQEEITWGDDVVDLGCGNGTIAVWVALRDRRARVHAVDQSASAVLSAQMTAEANGVDSDVRVLREDGLSSWDDASVETILLNPPFHRGAAVDPTAAHELITEAGRALASGGRLFCVWNSHLRHRRLLDNRVGPTRQLARNAKFTVTVSQKR